MTATSEVSLDTRKFLLALFVDLVEDLNYKNCFKSGHREVHQFFWRLTQTAEQRPFVADLLFDTNGNYPYCDRIDELLQEFQLSGVLSRPNPTYKYNDIAITSSPSAEEFKQSLAGSTALQKTYDSIFAQFKAQLGVS
jgi:hypothetical protein